MIGPRFVSDFIFSFISQNRVKSQWGEQGIANEQYPTLSRSEISEPLLFRGCEASRGYFSEGDFQSADSQIFRKIFQGRLS